MTKHKRTKTRKKVPSQNVVILLFLSIAVFTCIVLYKNHRESVLGTTIGSMELGSEGQMGTTQPTVAPTTRQLIQPTSAPLPTVAPTSVPTVAVNPTQPVTQVPNPTPTLIVPSEPIFVPVTDPTKDAGQVDIAAKDTTIIIESSPTGLTTTTQELTPKTEPVTEAPTVITSKESQTTQAGTSGEPVQAVVESEPSVIDKFIALLSGEQAPAPTIVQETSTFNTATEQSKVENQPVLYQQVYVSDPSTPTYTTDTKETVAAMNEWLGLNSIAFSSSGTESFNISQEGVDAYVTPFENKIAVNLSRMELLVNTDTGFKPLTYPPHEIQVYLQDLNVISEEETIVVRNTPTELVYDVKGTSTQYLFAFIPVGVQKQVCISAKTKEVCGIQQSMLSKILDMLSV